MTTAKTPSVSAEPVMKKLQDAWSQRNVTALNALYATDAIVHDPMYPQPLKGREAIRKDMDNFFKAFPDMTSKFTHSLSKAEIMAVELVMNGTHKGALVGPAGSVPATNRKVELHGACFARVNAQGLIAEEWRYFDPATLSQQLGIKRS